MGQPIIWPAEAEIRAAVAEHGTYRDAARALGINHCSFSTRCVDLGIASPSIHSGNQRGGRSLQRWPKPEGRYRALQPLPLADMKAWIRGAMPGQSFILFEGSYRDLPYNRQLALDCWCGGGFIKFGYVQGLEKTTGETPGHLLRVTRTAKSLGLMPL